MGYFRFLLAVAVCANHLWIIGGVGRYAVFSFYILSGYLMTTIILEKYGTSRIGLYKYALNRFLRIYPMYLMAFAITIIALYFFGAENVTKLDSNISIPSSIKGWFMNITLFGLDFGVKSRTIPPSWTLFVEVFFYAFIPIAARIGKRFISLWLVASVIYHIIVMFTSKEPMMGWDGRYGNVMAGSLGFSIGCFFRFNSFSWVNSKLAVSSSAIAFVCCYGVTALWFILSPDKSQLDVMSSLFFYVNMISSAILVSKLFSIRQSEVGRRVGDLSYPFYLLHIPVGFVIFKSFDLHARSFGLFVSGTILTIVLCLLLSGIDKKINSIRDRVRAL